MWNPTHKAVIVAVVPGIGLISHMASFGKIAGLALLGLVAGTIAGGLLGLGGGLAWTSLADTSGFEGYSGFVVVYWLLAGIILGALAGLIAGARRGRRPG
jgi:hypothetical protein